MEYPNHPNNRQTLQKAHPYYDQPVQNYQVFESATQKYWQQGLVAGIIIGASMGFTFWLFILLGWFAYCVYKPTITQIFFQVVDRILERYSTPASFISSLYTAHRPEETATEVTEERKERKERKHKSKDKKRSEPSDPSTTHVYTQPQPLPTSVYKQINPSPAPTYGSVVIPSPSNQSTLITPQVVKAAIPLLTNFLNNK